jgi:tetratricopeptide (TPR) repeat protein
MDDAEMNTPAYIRRIYLQDLFRFFRLNPVRNEFCNIFGEYSYKCLFINDALLEGTDHQAYYKEITTFLIKRNRKKDAEKLISSVYDEEYKDYDYHMLMAYLGNDPKLHYELALRINPNSERALQGLGRLLFQDEYYDQALNVYNQLVEINPDKKSYQLNKSVCLTNVQRYDEAEQILFKLNYEDPDNLNVARVLAWTLTCNGKYEQAGRLYDQLMDEVVITATGDWINYGYYLWFSGKITEAADCFRRYIVDNFTLDKRWGESYHITRRERGLCEAKGITAEEIQMMTDLIDL